MKKYQVVLFVLLFYGIRASAQASDRDQSIQNDFQNYVNAESSRNYSGSFLPVFTNKENTVGSRYLFGRWVHGKVVNANSEQVNDDTYVFNYDKINRKLLATQDNKTVLEINDEDLQSFTLAYDENTVVFERVPLINKTDFFVTSVESEKGYSLYKKLQTRFQKANFTTNGIFQSGKNYDEYVDESEYYVVFPGNKEVKKVELTRKSLRDVFKSNMTRVRRYYTEHSGETFDENFLGGLVNFLNSRD